jgi:tartrate dehydratase alpha subunit/fumarate hydratase class I-like protein
MEIAILLFWFLVGLGFTHSYEEYCPPTNWVEKYIRPIGSIICWPVVLGIVIADAAELLQTKIRRSQNEPTETDNQQNKDGA